MLNIKWIISNPDKADKAFKRRGLKPLANKLIRMSQSRSQVFVKLENLLEQRNNMAISISLIKTSLSNEFSNHIHKNHFNYRIIISFLFGPVDICLIGTFNIFSR